MKPKNHQENKKLNKKRSSSSTIHYPKDTLLETVSILAEYNPDNIEEEINSEMLKEENAHGKLKKIPVVISIIMLLLAIPPIWPYGYYTLLRLVVCGTAIYGAWLAKTINKQNWMWIFGLIALLFNPVIPVHLDKDMWGIIDLVVAILFFISIFKLSNKKK